MGKSSSASGDGDDEDMMGEEATEEEKQKMLKDREQVRPSILTIQDVKLTGGIAGRCEKPREGSVARDWRRQACREYRRCKT
jgi:hypothetical protein